jgi:uncharacterized protein (TIGR02391 family)
MKNKKNKSSISDIIKLLWQEDFFSKHRGLSEISFEISTKGFHFSLATLSTCLIRLVKSNSFLSRQKKSGQWKYVQKIPVVVAGRQYLVTKHGYDFHPKIKEVSLKQFSDGNFKEAIQNALVEVINQVKIRTGYPTNANGKDLDGDDLMNRIFGCDNQVPQIKFNSLKTGLDKAEQRGIMNLFKGVVGIRDRKAHLNFIQNDHLKTIEYLSLASLLLRLLDEYPQYS